MILLKTILQIFDSNELILNIRDFCVKHLKLAIEHPLKIFIKIKEKLFDTKKKVYALKVFVIHSGRGRYPGYLLKVLNFVLENKKINIFVLNSHYLFYKKRK